MQARVELVGIYSVEVTRESIIDAIASEFGDVEDYLGSLDELDRIDYSQFDDLYLIEVMIHDRAGGLDPGQFQQEEKGQPEDCWQVAYDEKSLNEDGTDVLDVEEATDSVRLAFYLHCVKLDQPLLTPYGAIPLPKPVAMPERLKRLFKYIPVD